MHTIRLGTSSQPDLPNLPPGYGPGTPRPDPPTSFWGMGLDTPMDRPPNLPPGLGLDNPAVDRQTRVKT